MASLSEGDFELDGYLIGRGRPVFVTEFDPGTGDLSVQDARNPVGENLLFGRDQRWGPTWTLKMSIASDSSAAALQALSVLQGKWQSSSRGPGDESILRYRLGNRVRFVYGRPRRFRHGLDKLIRQGIIRTAIGEFDTADTLHYDDEAQSLTVGLIPVNSGGLRAPLRAPLTASPGSSRQGLVTVGGDSPAPVEVVFAGPVTNPVVSSTGWQIGLNATLAYDQTVTVNARTGTALRNDGASLAGALTRRTYLPEARLRPGAREIVYAGVDPTGLSSCTVRWRNTFKSF